MDSIQNVQIKPYTRWNSNGSEIGIHDLLAHDLRSIEVIIYEAKSYILNFEFKLKISSFEFHFRLKNF